MGWDTLTVRRTLLLVEPNWLAARQVKVPWCSTVRMRMARRPPDTHCRPEPEQLSPDMLRLPGSNQLSESFLKWIFIQF